MELEESGSLSSDYVYKAGMIFSSGGAERVGGAGFPGGSAGKESSCNAGDLGSIPRLGRSPGEGKGYPLQYSGLENSKDHIVHGFAKSRTRLSDFQSWKCPIVDGELGLSKLRVTVC